MTHGIFICDYCETIVGKANVIPMRVHVVHEDMTFDRSFEFAFCRKHNGPEFHKHVLSAAVEEAKKCVKK